ncbi:F-box domain-containing protein [Heracleum sosnowskyi]|uniref:F-box domain-containing protein n=1 Tax=Heracleum sosnowskyi TaxID=360622 RepID=A0AAD8HSJ1_9APIA|nr:F-box domain-containing protein [Heracleum sosnowskyi]
MMFNNNQYVSIFDLPEELLAEILKRLPVKSIFHCMFVQKSWYNLIKTPMFVTLHLNYQKISPHNHHKYLLFRNCYCNTLTVRYDDVQCKEYCTIETIPHLPDYFFWHASSYGLMCVSTMFFEDRYDPNIYLWNPLVQKYKTLPDSSLPRFSFKEREWPAREWQALAFGFVLDINDYLVVHIVKLDSSSESELDSHSDSVMIGVYSLNTNTWKKKIQDNVSIYGIDGYDVAFVNGVAYWVGFNSNEHKIIMCFDTKTDILRQIPLPEWGYEGCSNPTIHPFNQSIAYIVHEEYRKVHMYVLKDDPLNGISWEKKTSVSLGKNTKWETLGLRNNGVPIFESLYNLILYDNDSDEECSFVESWDQWTPYPFQDGPAPTFFISPFVESLVLLDVDGNN